MSASLFLTQELARAKAYNGSEPCTAELFWEGCHCDACVATDQALRAEASERKAENEFAEMIDWWEAVATPSFQQEKDDARFM